MAPDKKTIQNGIQNEIQKRYKFEMNRRRMKFLSRSWTGIEQESNWINLILRRIVTGETTGKSKSKIRKLDWKMDLLKQLEFCRVKLGLKILRVNRRSSKLCLLKRNYFFGFMVLKLV